MCNFTISPLQVPVNQVMGQFSLRGENLPPPQHTHLTSQLLIVRLLVRSQFVPPVTEYLAGHTVVLVRVESMYLSTVTHGEYDERIHRSSDCGSLALMIVTVARTIGGREL